MERAPGTPCYRYGVTPSACILGDMIRSLVWFLAWVGFLPAPNPRPRLVVVITVDQLRPDYLDRYRSQLQGGLRLLVREGAVVLIRVPVTPRSSRVGGLRIRGSSQTPSESWTRPPR